MNSRAKFLLATGFLLALIFNVAIRASAQTSAGRIIGTVSDPQGAAVAGARVTVTSTTTGTLWETTTSADGAYQVLELPIGNYKVSVDHGGFTKAVTEVQTLEINQSLRIDVQLKLGSTTDVVEIYAQAPQVETLNPTVGATVTGAPIQDLPLNGRDPLDLALTQPGVTPAPGTILPSVAGVPSGKFSIAGGRDNSVTYLLDGGDNTSVTYGAPVVDPNPDTVAEFRILDNNYTAEYGRSGGGVVSVVTKSGTNSWHGSAYDYLRNDALDANNFFNKSAGAVQPRPVLKRNQFGGTVGGPVKKDKMFFFFGYQGQRQHSVTVGSLLTVFTPAELTGDFSRSANGGPDPGVAGFLQSNPYFQPNAALAAQAIIDPTKIDPVAQAYITNKLLPVSAGGTLVPNGLQMDNNDEYTGKFDFNASAKDHISVTLSKFHNPQMYPFITGFAPNVPGFPGKSQFDNYFGTISWLRVISPYLVNEAHITVQRDNNQLNDPAAQQPGPSALGVNITPDQVTGPPQILLNNSGPQIGFNLNGPARYADTTYLYADTVTWIRGRHAWKAGASFGAVQNNAFFAYAVDGQFFFFGSNTLNDRADFLIGAPELFLQYPKGFSAVRSHQYGAFVQDEWKATPRLTLTLGLRYEYSSPKSDPENRNYMIIPGEQSKRFPNAPLGLVFPGDPGAPSHGVNFPDRNDWAPRLGFAWDVFGKGRTSLRGGGGVFYDLLLAQDNQYQNGTPPFFSAATLFLPPSANAQNASLSDPYGTVGAVNPFPSKPPASNLDFFTAGFAPYFGASSVFIDPHLRTPYIYQYNLSIQQQLGSGLAAEVGYVGSSSHKLVAEVDSDPFIRGTASRVLNQLAGTQTQCAVVDPNDPNCPYSAMIATFANRANANYNGLLASLTKREGDWHGMGSTFFTLSYTWSHIIDDADGFARNSSSVSYYNSHAFRASGDSDIRHRVVLSGGWALPFEHLWTNGPKKFTGGWNLYPILFAQTGLPMDVNGGQLVDYVTPGPSGDGDQNLVRPDWVGGSPTSLNPHQVRTFAVNGAPVTGHFVFDPSRLSLPGCYASPDPPGTGTGCPTPTYGTLSRNFFRGPGRVNFDLSLEKRTQLAEHVELMFRAEFFNLFNHTEWKSSIASVPIGSLQLGQITQTYDPRIGQLALRLAF